MFSNKLRPVKTVILAACFLLLMTQLKVAYCSVPEIQSITATTEGSITIVNVTIVHDPPVNSTHFIHEVELIVDGNQVYTNYYYGPEGQESGTFSSVFEIPAIHGSVNATATAYCIVHGWTNEPPTFVIPEFSALSFLLIFMGVSALLAVQFKLVRQRTRV